MGNGNEVPTIPAVTNEEWLTGLKALYGQRRDELQRRYRLGEMDRTAKDAVLAAWYDVCIGAIRKRFYVSRDSAARLLTDV